VLSHEIEKQISSFPSILKDSDNVRRNEFDRLGTSIWNICTRLRRQHEVDKPQDVPLVLLVARVFSFLLLDCAHQIGKSEAGNVLRLMKIGIKAGKSCLG
jgi:type I restriction-modification system DNA methylase subunit